MQVFKCAMRIVFRNPWLLLIYVVALSFMGIAMASGFDLGKDTAEYERANIDYAIIDRDGSDLVKGVDAFLQTQGVRVDVEDADRSMQDAVAKGDVGYMLIIPEGYGEAFATAVEEGTELPAMDAVYGFSSPEGALVDASLANYLSELAIHLGMNGGDVSAASANALESARDVVDVSVISNDGYKPLSDQFCFYLQFCTYVLFASIVACLGMLLSTLNRTDIRRRNLSSPVSYLFCNAQIAIACLVVTAIVWAWTFSLGAVCYPASFASIDPLGAALMAATAFVFALIPLSVAFLVGQVGVGAVAANAIGNIAGLVISFLGGMWIPLDIAGPEVTAVAHFLPGFWYTDALSQAAHLAGTGWEAVAPILANMGVLLLFAIAIFLVGLVIGKMRVQTSASGGNSAASMVVYNAN